ncbi:hypothetical protein evm_007302 [Chilo suppressalis]|nr:hypothetical protein evm_007302 [Chilo suppressalis]
MHLGTNIYSALDVAIDLVKKGVGWTPEPAQSNETTTELVQEHIPVPASNTEVSAEFTKLEPIVIFLTDGDPTVGVTDPTRIINHLTEKNTGFNKATIFSLAFGEDADRKFLRKLSLKNDGFMRHIYEASDAALQLRDFYRQVSSPLLADVKFIYPKKQKKFHADQAADGTRNPTLRNPGECTDQLCYRGPHGPRRKFLLAILKLQGSAISSHYRQQTGLEPAPFAIRANALTNYATAALPDRVEILLAILKLQGSAISSHYSNVLIHHHHQPLDVPTAGEQAFPMDGIGRLGRDPPRGPSRLAGANDCRCNRDQRLTMTSEARRNSR